MENVTNVRNSVRFTVLQVLSAWLLMNDLSLNLRKKQKSGGLNSYRYLSRLSSKTYIPNAIMLCVDERNATIKDIKEVERGIWHNGYEEVI